MGEKGHNGTDGLPGQKGDMGIDGRMGDPGPPVSNTGVYIYMCDSPGLWLYRLVLHVSLS